MTGLRHGKLPPKTQDHVQPSHLEGSLVFDLSRAAGQPKCQPNVNQMMIFNGTVIHQHAKIIAFCRKTLWIPTGNIP
jgi:hypothetical protein